MEIERDRPLAEEGQVGGVRSAWSKASSQNIRHSFFAANLHTAERPGYNFTDTGRFGVIMEHPIARSAQGGEVAPESLAQFRAISRILTGKTETLFENGLEHLVDHSARFSWDEICELYRRVEKLGAGRFTMPDWGGQIFDLPRLGTVLRAAGVVASPKLLYTLGNRFALARTFAHLDVRQQVRDDGRIEIEISIPADYQDSVEFYQVTLGVLRAFPRLLGLPDALVALERRPRHGRYVITPPPSATLWARINRVFIAVLAGRRALNEMTAQQHRLNAQFEELKEAYASVSQALETKRRFLSIMSHELRTPLHGIVGACEELRHEKDEQAREALLDALTTCSGSFARLAGGILELAGNEQEALTPLPIVSRPHEALTALVQRWKRPFQEKKIELVLELDARLPKAIRVDESRMIRMLDHLIDNGLKFTDRGEVRVRAAMNGSKLMLEVKDTGIGIAEEHHEAIFETFKQLDDSSTRKRGGSGLGLALIRRLSGVMGGNVQLKSALGAGSTFTLELPCDVVEQAAPESPEVEKSEKLAVLVADDNRVNRMVLARMLKRLGYTVEEVEDGAQAVAAAAERAPIAIFMDCEMPVMDGFEAARKIRSEVSSDILIIATTAYVSDADRARCRDAGMDDFLAKPVTPDQITAAMRRLLPSESPGSI